MIRTKFAIVFIYARLVYAQTGLLLRTARFVMRAIFWWQETTQWLAFIETHPLRRVPDDIRRQLVEKIHRPYARRRLGVEGRVRLLIEHYSIMGSAFSPEILVDMVAGTEMKLASLQGRGEDDRYTITLRRNRYLHQQGELALAFLTEPGKVNLGTLPINLSTDRLGRRVLSISGMQASRPDLSKDAIAHATRSLDGLRPKRAVVEAAYALARWLGADIVVATSKRNHVTQVKGRRWRDIRADYDGFWMEFGATLQADGDYSLPSSLPRRNPEDVASKRRKELMRRYERQDSITAAVTASLCAIGAGEAGLPTTFPAGSLLARGRPIRSPPMRGNRHGMKTGSIRFKGSSPV